MPGSIELRACPFCGGEAHALQGRNDTMWRVGCDDCDCLGFSGLGWLYETDDDAARAWNRRAERTCRISERKQRLGQTQIGVEKSCSECGFMFGFEKHYERLFAGMVLDEVDPPNYCPNCGARLEGE